MRRAEEDAIVAEMVKEMLACERFTVQDWRNKWQLHPATFGDLLTRASDVVREEHGVTFRPGPHGSRQRATYQETLNQSTRRHRKGLRSIERGAACAVVAGSMATTDVDRAAAEKTASLRKLQLAMAKTRSRKRLSAADGQQCRARPGRARRGGARLGGARQGR